MHRKMIGIKKNKYFKIFQPLIKDKNLLHMNRHSICAGIAIGLGCSWIPIPFHTVIAILMCIPARGNIAWAATAIWVANPITMPEMYFFAYELGANILKIKIHINSIDISFDGFLELMQEIWQPLLLGCGICGIVTGMVSFCVMQALWREQHSHKSHKRKQIKR